MELEYLGAISVTKPALLHRRIVDKLKVLTCQQTSQQRQHLIPWHGSGRLECNSTGHRHCSDNHRLIQILAEELNCCADVDVDDGVVTIEAEARVTAKTGVEMEALVGASIAALTIYDMCKALSHDIVIKETKLMEKTGLSNWGYFYFSCGQGVAKITIVNHMLVGVVSPDLGIQKFYMYQPVGWHCNDDKIFTPACFGCGCESRWKQIKVSQSLSGMCPTKSLDVYKGLKIFVLL